MMHIEKIRRTTVVERVMEKMKELIATGQFKVHEQIPPEQELADMFGVARSSMREAIKIFHYLGVLESQTGRGTYVCDRGKISTEALTWSILLGEHDIYEMVHLREVLEQAGLKMIAESYRDDPGSVASFMAELENEVAAMRTATEQRDMNSLIEADYNFHGVIIRGSKNSLFSAIYSTLRSFMQEEIKKTYEGADIGKAAKEHQEFIDAIKSGNVEKVLELHQAHIRSITGKLESMLGTGQPATV
ncbi:MAG: FCD domain-containing protein [Spirochaetia bacterium]|jgi:DNA-binding FadR family transcriptional regulator